MEKKRILIAVLLLAAFMVLVPAVAADDYNTDMSILPDASVVSDDYNTDMNILPDSAVVSDDYNTDMNINPIGGTASVTRDGSIIVTSNVAGASVTISNAATGSTVDSGVIGAYDYQFTSEPLNSDVTRYTVKVSKSGYKTSKATVYGSQLAGGDCSISVYLTKIENGYLYIESSPSGTVYIDGESYGQSPVSATLSPGYYSVRVVKAGYDTYAKSVSVTGGNTTRIYPTLSPETAYGYISVNSSPSYANVYIDGSFKGQTPVTVTVPTGSHTVKVTKSGYTGFSTNTYVYEGNTNTIMAVLSAEVTNAYVLVGSSPAGASVYIDGEYIGVTPNSGTLTCTVTANTTHTLTVKASGYETYSTGFNLVTGETKLFNPTLTVIQPEYGYLNVTSVPSGATVYIDTSYAGTSPLVQSVEAGTHTIKVSCLGYNDYTTTVTVAAGQTVPVQATMTPGSTPATSPFPILGILAALGIAGIVALRRK